MATTQTLKTAVQNGGQLAPQDRLETLIGRLDIKTRLETILGKRAAVFGASVLSLVKATPQLQACQPITIIGSAMVAATLDLPINKQLGFAYIVPYGSEAQFQMGYKGFIQLAIRSGQYKTIHATEVYQDEIKQWDPLRGEIEFTEPSVRRQRDNGEMDKIVGYVAFFRLMNGFEKTIYMTKKQCLNHARRYSKSFGNSKGIWKTNEHEMCLKTPLRLLLGKYGILSVEMQTALRADQAVIRDTTGEFPEGEYVDAMESEASNVAESVAEGPSTEDKETSRDPEIPFGD